MKWVYLFYIVSITLAYKESDPIEMVYLKTGHRVPVITVDLTILFLRQLKYDYPKVWIALYEYAAHDTPMQKDDIAAVANELGNESFFPLHYDIREIIKSVGPNLYTPIESGEQKIERELKESLKHQGECY